MVPKPIPVSVQQEGLLRWPAWKVAVLTSALPIVSFASCVAISFLYNFEKSVSTHCNVANYLPTVSAAISLSPQRYIWRFGIALHTTLRLMWTAIYYNYYKKTGHPNPFPWFLWLCRLSFILQCVEILSLLGLTVVASKEYKVLHENLFVSFMVTSLLYMLLMCIQYYLSKRKSWSEFQPQERQQQYRLVLLFLVNISTFFISIYFFFRHNWYCEPGIYSLYALFEYLVIISNIGFHVAEAYELMSKEFIFGAVRVEDKSH
ncbi:post-GPI attachment to proteins factor 2-like [Ptychodera flava]|uniref:post-GPI attachment to proteins factor 2-like n=1 Tax=Ptychodera flava TaxID=63121 RepID=UPI00396A6BFC